MMKVPLHQSDKEIKNFLKDSVDAFQAWSQWAQWNLTFKQALKYSGGNIVTGKQIGRAHV